MGYQVIFNETYILPLHLMQFKSIDALTDGSTDTTTDALTDSLTDEPMDVSTDTLTVACTRHFKR